MAKTHRTIRAITPNERKRDSLKVFRRVHSGAYFLSYWQEFVTGYVNITENMKTWNKSIDSRIHSRIWVHTGWFYLILFKDELHWLFTADRYNLAGPSLSAFFNIHESKCYLYLLNLHYLPFNCISCSVDLEIMTFKGKMAAISRRLQYNGRT